MEASIFFTVLVLCPLCQAEQTARPQVTTDYNEHLEIDFDDKDDTPPPWEALETPTATTPAAGVQEDLDWVPDAVRDVAYYLRQHKFNEYDRRYTTGNFTGERGFVAAFPTLHTLHWEVQDACEIGFLECLRYLQDRLSSVRLRRDDDTVKAMRDNQLYLPANETGQAPSGNKSEDIFESMEEKMKHENREQVIAMDKMCTDLRGDDESNFEGFVGPLDRFQWRTTASYFMCAFAMRGEGALRHLGEPCDNWAWCLDWTLGPAHGDPRASDKEPFGCARYSFCPDPCCPLRLVRSAAECRSSDSNPCRFATEGLAELEAAERPQCGWEPRINSDLEGMRRNHWNTSCRCARPGYRWESRFGFCIDTDECKQPGACSGRHRECVNTEGSFQCRCRWGWTRSMAGHCVEDPLLRDAMAARRGGAEVPEQSKLSPWEVAEGILFSQ